MEKVKNIVRQVVLIGPILWLLELFQNELGEDFKIINQSATDEEWRKKGWWESNVGRFLTIGELGKIFFNFTKETTEEMQSE